MQVRTFGRDRSRQRENLELGFVAGVAFPAGQPQHGVHQTPDSAEDESAAGQARPARARFKPKADFDFERTRRPGVMRLRSD
jgi:hypothetical protein